MEMSLVHLSAELRVTQTALETESDLVRLKENCLGQLTEMLMELSSACLTAVRMVMKTVLL